MKKLVAEKGVTESNNKVEGNVKAPIAENSAKAQKLLKRKDAKTEVTPKAKTAPKTEKAPKVKKERALSNEKLGEKLYAEKASEQVILNAFMKVYKEKKNITDKKFIQARANIYLSIAAKRAEAKKAVKVAKAS